MLRATHLGGYMKNGQKIMTYEVSGPIAEVEEYLTIQETRVGKAAGTWVKSAGNKPIFHLNATMEMRNGRMPQPTYDLMPNYAKDRIIIDTTANDLREFAEITKETRTEQAKIAAGIKMGIIQVPTFSRGFATASAQQAPAGAIVAPLGEDKDLSDKIMELAGAGGDGTEDLSGEHTGGAQQ